jgi:predicted nucleic acid-binding Zn ribbon protein
MIYEFQCRSGHITEIFTSDYDLKEVTCETCGKVAKKILSYSFFKGEDLWRVQHELDQGRL